MYARNFNHNKLARPIEDHIWQRSLRKMRLRWTVKGTSSWGAQAPRIFACEEVSAAKVYKRHCASFPLAHMALERLPKLPPKCRLRQIIAYPVVDFRSSRPLRTMLLQNLRTREPFNGVLVPGRGSYSTVFHFDGEWWGLFAARSQRMKNNSYIFVLHDIKKQWTPPQGVLELLPKLIRLQFRCLNED